MGPEDLTKVVRLGCQCLDLMSRFSVLAFIPSMPLNGVVNSKVNFRNDKLYLTHKAPVVNTYETHDYCHAEDVPVPM